MMSVLVKSLGASVRVSSVTAVAARRCLCSASTNTDIRALLKEELKVAMRAKDKEKTMVTKGLISDILYAEKNKTSGDFTAADVMAVVQKAANQRKDSISQFSAAGRADLAEKEQSELKIIMAYLPKQLSEEEMHAKAAEAVAAVGAKTVKDMGKVMKWLSSNTDPASMDKQKMAESIKSLLGAK